MEADELHQMIIRYNAGSATAAERLLVEKWYEDLEGIPDDTDVAGMNALQSVTRNNLHNMIPELEKQVVPVRKMYTILKWAAACIVVIAGSWFYLSRNVPDKNNTLVQGPATQNELVPGGNFATLTLADGKTIVLNEMKNGKLADESGTSIYKNADGEIEYKVQNAAAGTGALFNTISTPRGGTWLVVLPDETKVWLNAASSVRFPVCFSVNERNIVMKGEAYFEVAKNPQRPFHVRYGSQQLEVLGTHFNINAYTDEPFITTTLLEGAVKINNTQVLSPGQQLKVDSSGISKLVRNADLTEAVGWKSGSFVFNETDIYSVMRQVSRWYNADVSFAGQPATDHFNGQVSRKDSLAHFFKILELQGFHCKVEGRKIVVYH